MAGPSIAASDSVHINIVDFTFVDSSGSTVWQVVPVWKEALLAAASTGTHTIPDPGGSLYKIKILIVLMILATLVGGTIVVVSARWGLGGGKSDPMQLPQVSITILGKHDDIRIHGLNADDSAGFLRGGDLLRPSTVAIRSPDGNVFTLTARSVSVLTDLDDRNVVTDAYVRRPLEPMQFQDAVADLTKTLGQIGVEPNETLKKMATWGNVPGLETGMGAYSSRVGAFRMGTKMDVLVDISPDPKHGWYYLMMFESDSDQRPSMKAIRLQQSTTRADSHS